MEMPLRVSPHCPSRNALLLFGSSQDSVPGTKVSYICLPNSSAAMVSGLLITTLPFSSTILPPCDHTSQWVQVLPSPVALPSANPGGRPFALRPWHSLRKPGRSFGNVSNPAAFMALMRWTSALPAQPLGTAIHLPLWVQYDLATSYHPPYLPPR